MQLMFAAWRQSREQANLTITLEQHLWPLLLHLQYVPQSRISTAAFRLYPQPSILEGCSYRHAAVAACGDVRRFRAFSRFSVLDVPILGCATLDLEKGNAYTIEN
jgi:hypothetical protein